MHHKRGKSKRQRAGGQRSLSAWHKTNGQAKRIRLKGLKAPRKLADLTAE